jgi:uncharacterized protein YraI
MLRKALLLLTLSFSLVMSILPVSAQQEAPATGIDVIISQNVNLRSLPSTDGAVVVIVRTGTAFRVDGRFDNGEWVRGITQNGQVGWMVNGPTNLSIAQIASLPVIDTSTPFALSAPPPNVIPSTAPSGTVPRTNTRAGTFSYGGHMADFDENAFNWMRHAGMTWIKKQVRYGGQNPSDLQDWINVAHNNGFRLLLGVIGDKNALYNEGYIDQYAAFVGGLAALGVDAVEVWNEPNIEHEWPAGRIDAVHYTSLLRASYNAIKANNPATLVISGAPAPTGAEAAFPGLVVNDNNYIAAMARAGAGNYLDCVGVHYNEGIVPPTARTGDPRGNSEYYTRYLPSMIDVYYRAFGKPLCFTELGYLTPEGFGPLSEGFSWASNVTLAQQAQWVAGAVNYAQNTGRVRLVIIWNVNFTNYDADPMAGFALIRPGNTCPACDALATR